MKMESDMITGNDSNSSIEIQLDNPRHQLIGIINGDDHVVVREEHVMDEQYLPCVTITEQPQSRGFRFRYECEGPSHGGLQGHHSERGRKTYPSIKIDNYRFSARIEVSLVTADNDNDQRNHPHKLVGKNCDDGLCITEIKDCLNLIQFQNMSVQHVTKKKASEVLCKRIKRRMLRDKKIKIGDINANIHLSAEEEDIAAKQAKDQAKSTQLNVVRLCFQVYIQDRRGQCTIALSPVYSHPIYDSKSPGASTLKICRMDKYGGCCTGNEEVFLLCEKVQKDDIAVKFIEVDNNGKTKWEEFGNFGPLDVHRQFAIVFRTPAYWDTNIDKAVNVYIVLQRKSDGEQSDPKSFTYYPQNLDKDEIKKKKRKKIPLDYSYSQFRGIDSTSGGGSNGFGGERGDDFGTRTILPNGNVVNNQSALPTTVVQAVQDSYDTCSSSNSPYSPYFHEYGVDPMYGGSNLETDSEPVYPSESIFTRDFPVDEVDGMFENMNIGEDISSGKPSVSVNIKPDNIHSIIHQTRGSKQTDITVEQSEPDRTLLDTKSKDTKSVETQTTDKGSKGESYKIIERTLAAMQDYAETSDIRYLLIVQRHLASVQNSNGDLPIHLAVINEQLPALQGLLSIMSTLPNSHFKINSFNYIRQTPLHLAVLTKQPEVIELLLHYGADPAIMDRSGNTPANLAVQYYTIPCLKSLLKYLRPGVTANRPFPELDHMNYEGYCPAHIAAQHGNVEMLRLLNFGKASLDLPDGKSGRTPLHHAVETDDLSVSSYLLMEAETDVNAQCFDGNTPLHIACGRNLVGMAALLITAGADAAMENEEAYDEGYDSETSDGGGNNGEKRGMRPADYVRDNEQILRVLHGDLVTGDGHSDIEEDGGDPSTSTQFKSLAESGLGSFIPITSKGDLDKLHSTTVIELSLLLDPVDKDKDVFALADVLGFGHLKNALEGLKTTETSPTRFLLDYYETSDGTLQKLKCSLENIGRMDAASLIPA